MNKEQTKEYLEWLEELRQYATGEKQWDTGKIWVCESHPLMKSDVAEREDSFISCKCGAPAMPPYYYKEESGIPKENDNE